MKEGWKYNSLGIVCKIYNGNSINADYKKTHYMGLSEGYPFIATKDVSFDGIINYNNGVRIPFKEGLKVAKPSSVFICVEGGSAGRKIGLVDREVCFGNKLFCLESKGSVLGSFIYYYLKRLNSFGLIDSFDLKSALFQEQFSERLTGLIGGVSAKKFNDISIIYPPLSEQQRIVDYLDSVFAKIDAMKANAEKALNEAKALFQKALEKAMEPKEGWEEKKLEEITTKIGSGATPKGGKKVYIQEGVSLVRSMNVHYNEFKYKDLAYINENTASQLKGVELKKNDVLFNITGASIARCCVIPNDVIPGRVNQHVSILRPRKEMVLPQFLCLGLISSIHQSELLEIGLSGSTRQAITKADLESHFFPIPSLSEQRRIVARLDSLSAHIRELVEINKKLIAECDALKQALLRKVFE